MLRLVTVCRPAKAFIFYFGHPNVCTAIIIIVNSVRRKERVPTYTPFSTDKILLDLPPDCTPQGD